jgi:hypothetical protein
MAIDRLLPSYASRVICFYGVGEPTRSAGHDPVASHCHLLTPHVRP